jgi:PBSX family phage terminase large subunit
MQTDSIFRIMSKKQIVSIVESSLARISVWVGAVRAGKTIASLLAFLIAISMAPDKGLILICGKTLNTIQRNVIETLQDRAIFGILADYVHYTPGATKAVILGRTVWLIGANDVRAQGNIRGVTACLAYVDEATLLPSGFWTMLLSRLSVPGSRLIATTNPDGPAHWLRKDYLQRAGEINLASWHFTLDDNPSLDDAFVRDLKTEYVGLWYRRFILGEWCLAEGAIFESWNPDIHVVDVVPPIERWISLGIDYGTTNSFAAELLGMSYPEPDGKRRLYFTNEWSWNSKHRRKSLTAAEYSQELKTWMTSLNVRPEVVVVDPSEAAFRQQMYRDGWTAYAADNDVIGRLRVMSSLFALNLLKVSSRCPNLIEEIPGYAWDADKAAKGTDAPIKVDDHHIDGGGYGIYTPRHIWSASIPLNVNV